MNLTNAQIDAITTKNKTLLLSAAAGSGKTSTLTRRIINSITDKENPKDISKMLIVTFTRASANDLKTKIFNAISDALALDPTNKHLTGQLIKLGSAKISTIDAFYLSAVKQNFSSLSLSSSFRICDSSEANLIAKNVMTEVIDKFYDIDSDFSALCECFEKIRDTENVSENVLISIYYECMSTPEGIEYLKKCSEDAKKFCQCDFLDTPYGHIIKAYASSMFNAYIEEYDKTLNNMAIDKKLYEAYSDAMEADRILCIKALNILRSNDQLPKYSELATLFNNFEFVKLKRLASENAGELSEYVKKLRDDFKTNFGFLKTEFFCYSNDDFNIFLSATSKNLDILYRTLSEFETRFFEEKKHRNILQLTDIKRYALKLFADPDGNPTALAKSYSEMFTDIYIDEYQDVDPVQDLIFRCISTPTNRFMVGDIKQSIYSFRGAHPKLFADYRASFPNHNTDEAELSNAKTIFMSENFRCSKPIIDFTNIICSPIFRACGDSIGYTKDDDLVFAKPIKNEEEASPIVNVALFAKNSKNELEAKGISPEAVFPSTSEAEAIYIAQQISNLIKHGKKQDGSPIRARDIAVLFRSNSHAVKISNALSDLEIMSTNTEFANYFQNPDVMMTLCILNAVDNPQRDIYLAGAMRSPIFGFTLDELILIHSKGEKTDSLYDKVCIYTNEKNALAIKCRTFNETLCQWRSISLSMPIDKLLQYIFSSDAFVASGFVCDKSSSGKGGNLQQLYEYARTFEASSFKGLYNFIEFINNIIENGETLNIQSEETNNDAVTLTTIHKSKGLEFPVCFVCCCASDFKFGSSFDDLSFEYGIGVAMTISDSTGFAKYASPLKKALDLHSRIKSVEEEMRVLYVALTRAREQLFVTANFPRSTLSGISSSMKFKSAFHSNFSILNAKCYMDWILPILESNNTSCANLYKFTTDQTIIPNVINPTTKEANNETFNEELYRKLKSSFSFSYPYKDIGKIPAKLSVSKLSPDILDESTTSVSLFDVEKSPIVPEFFLGTKKSASSTERGTATHLFLQFCDFTLLKSKGVLDTLDQLTAKKFIPENLSKIIYIDELEKIRQSDFLNDILNAKKVIREQRFNILLPAADFTQNNDFRENLTNENIAVQGVIDLILIDESDNILLYDYKTDRLSHKELTDSSLAIKKLNLLHGLQLSYYAKAIEYLFGKAPIKTAIYSTHAGRCFDIDVCSLTIPTDIL